jgi:hypothetical protein
MGQKQQGPLMKYGFFAWCIILADRVETRMSERQSGNAGRFSMLLVHRTLAEAQKFNYGAPFFDFF